MSQHASGASASVIKRVMLQSAQDIVEIEQQQPGSVLPGTTIYACISAAAAQHPDKIALSHLLSANPEDAPRQISYRTLLAQITQAANLFSAVSQGADRASVSIILPMLPEALIAAWGAATAGIGNPINPYLEVGQVSAIMNAARATVLVTTTRRHGPGVWDKLDEIKAAVPTLRAVFIVDADAAADDFATQLAAQASTLAFTPTTDGSSEAIYLPTGGTTAAPKLVRMTHRGQLLAAWITGSLAGPGVDGVVGHAMPNFHVGGSVLLALRAIIFGQTLLTLTTDGFRNPGVIKNFWHIAKRHRMTSLVATPATAAAILAQPDDTSAGHCIRSFNVGGSTISVEVVRRFHERFGVWLREVWGMSEMHGAVSGHPDSGNEPVTGSVGQRLPWHQVKAVEVDAKNRFVRECAPGERGVLAITGPGVTPGYVDGSLDAEFFIQDMPDGARWANTGDLGTVDAQGYIWLFGRSKDVIIRGGHNIDPRMIEDVLDQHPAVQISAAVGRPDNSKGEMPIAYVQLKEGAQVTTAELLELCKARVQERAAVPLEIIILPQIPMTAVGKINKPVLRIDILRRVAQRTAADALGNRGSCEITIDESGRRPCVQLAVQANDGDAEAVRTRLQNAFQNFEFLTRIDVVNKP